MAPPAVHSALLDEFMGGANSGGQSQIANEPTWMLGRAFVSLCEPAEVIVSAARNGGRTWFGCEAVFDDAGHASFSRALCVLRLNIEAVRRVPGNWLHLTGALYGQILPGRRAWFHLLFGTSDEVLGMMGWLD